MRNSSPPGTCSAPRRLRALPALIASALLSLTMNAAADEKMALGRDVFTKLAAPPCGLCHALQDAGTTAEIGAKLEELKPEASRVEAAVRNGVGIMPSYAGKLTDAQIAAVAHYVSRAAAGK